MKRPAMLILAAIAPAAFPVWSVANPPIFVVSDEEGSASRVGAPASVQVNLAQFGELATKPQPLQLIDTERPDADPVPAQFVPESKGSKKGELWWMTPANSQGTHRFRLVGGGHNHEPEMSARLDEARQAVDINEGTHPVLRYHHGAVPPPPEIVEMFEKNRKPPLFYARGDYIHPVYGPDGEAMTDDYSTDHPHHRGICWAWPVVRWKGEARDLWAVRVLPEEPGGVWARPVRLDRIEAGPVLAAIDAVNVWKWGDRDAIVREEVAIRAFRQRKRERFLDIEVRMTALTDEVSIGGRPHAAYGGFNLRTFPEFDGRHIDMHIEPASARPRRAWFHLTGRFPGGKGPAGLLMLEHVTNPDYPNFPNPQTTDRVEGQYPRWRSVQPAWPGDREAALERGKPLRLKYRLWIHPGTSDEPTVGAVWASCAIPPRVTMEE